MQSKHETKIAYERSISTVTHTRPSSSLIGKVRVLGNYYNDHDNYYEYNDSSYILIFLIKIIIHGVPNNIVNSCRKFFTDLSKLTHTLI